MASNQIAQRGCFRLANRNFKLAELSRRLGLIGGFRLWYFYQAVIIL